MYEVSRRDDEGAVSLPCCTDGVAPLANSTDCVVVYLKINECKTHAYAWRSVLVRFSHQSLLVVLYSSTLTCVHNLLKFASSVESELQVQVAVNPDSISHQYRTTVLQ